ncbi:hypothetical protein A2865_01515 [Candidatus Woesebacteria bacterium RIFCSPHIGHO2_01_FULL_39_17]|uniref:Ferric oxidoreductase domain-containing protein n=3 Tax=Candidatus Woeseibacteriota TaxID=1752722 RepID=A0A0G0QT27_9BACT|nr:MAG: hypothetical protein US72_C0014G0034 [Microgenomates group bacterium GW2011_GWC1_38_12]KKQ93573.1 MAG: hypothetical protein UT19_C0010G0017 [Candidatus Woesebacteria bacterium GW2011_GWB1_39_10b]KKR13520.1 MAG: hypothetical protein UT40_C0015G0017 [Candidatus Woesebacteria bacterium GW2011_GWA1_39_21b]OGM22875.1 MAG: hypothetical protein A2865_01515 [Candidatus Woesebacteria bacterium RIFCSPHIGHO2_01_FULL_39_17]OGM61928.1 MAG: hypothetical protein A3A52_00085 [Candidatus Woesebacteria b
MSVATKRNIFWLLWLLIILSGPITVIRNSDIQNTFANAIVLTNFFQRITGLLASSLLFIQIILGSRMSWWLKIIGSKAYRIHTVQGLFAYGFMLVHPLFENIIVYQDSKSITESLSVFIPSLETQRDILLVFGRIAFLLATIAVVASYFRTKPFFRRNWRAFHILNYLVFYLVFWHMRIGSDIATSPFKWVSLIALVTVSGSLIYRILYPQYLKLRAKMDAEKKLQKA